MLPIVNNRPTGENSSDLVTLNTSFALGANDVITFFSEFDQFSAKNWRFLAN
jgi:hypothetical protein